MVNTFLPYADFTESARVLDDRRLGKQRIECHQILGILLDWPTKEGKKRTGWLNHPATKMWRGYTDSLKCYMDAIVSEWIKRGNNNSYKLWYATGQNPPWLGDNRLHSGYRQVLLLKNPDWYSQFNWTETAKYEYFWPC